MNFRESFYDLLFYNPFFKRLAISFLNSPLIGNNFLYQYFNNKNIKRVMDKYKKAPSLVVIENTNLCNSHCSMCPHDVMKRKQGVMAMNLFKKIIDDCAEIGVDHITLHNFGEPLIDKDFVSRVKYAKSKGISYVGTSTNGALLTTAISKQIIESGLDAINFSLDAFSKEAYQKIRVGLPYEKVMKNVKEFIDIRRNLGVRKPKIIVDMIETKFNQNERANFIAEWQNSVDKVNITTLHSWGGSFKDRAGKGDLHSSLNKIKREPCRFLWTDMVILWNGQISACCQDYDGRLIVGDLTKNSLSEIWRGKILETLRKSHLKGDYSQVSVCNLCDYRSVWWLFN